MSHEGPMHSERAPGHRALYAAAIAIALVAAVVAIVGQAFPGAPDVAGGACDAPGAAGCKTGDTWAFMAILLGGALTAMALLIAIALHATSAMRTAHHRHPADTAQRDADPFGGHDRPLATTPAPRRYSDLP